MKSPERAGAFAFAGSDMKRNNRWWPLDEMYPDYFDAMDRSIVRLRAMRQSGSRFGNRFLIFPDGSSPSALKFMPSATLEIDYWFQDVLLASLSGHRDN